MSNMSKWLVQSLASKERLCKILGHGAWRPSTVSRGGRSVWDWTKPADVILERSNSFCKQIIYQLIFCLFLSCNMPSFVMLQENWGQIYIINCLNESPTNPYKLIIIMKSYKVRCKYRSPNILVYNFGLIEDHFDR